MAKRKRELRPSVELAGSELYYELGRLLVRGDTYEVDYCVAYPGLGMAAAHFSGLVRPIVVFGLSDEPEAR